MNNNKMINKKEIMICGKTIPHISETATPYLNKSTIIYGTTNSGKTVIVKYIMNLLKDDIPNIFIFCPTDDPDSSSSYTRFVPSKCVITDLSNVPNLLADLWNRQIEAKSIYNKCNKLDILQKIYNKYPTDAFKKLIDRTTKLYNDGIRTLTENTNMSDDDKETKKTEFTESFDKNMRKIFKKSIEVNKIEYEKMTDLDEDEKQVITFIKLNPNIMLLFDDCQAQIAEWGKDTNIRKVFFQGRHNFITSIFLLQTNNGLHTDFRQNTFNNIFTSSNAAIGYFTNKSNNLSISLKREVEKIIEQIYQENTDPNLPKNYKKLVYCPQDPIPIKYILAKIITQMKFGDPCLWELSKKIEDNENEIINKTMSKSSFSNYY